MILSVGLCAMPIGIFLVSIDCSVNKVAENYCIRWYNKH